MAFLKKQNPFKALGVTDDEGNPILNALSSGVLQEGYTRELVEPDNKAIDPKYSEDLDEVIEQTGADSSKVDSSIKNLLKDVRQYRSSTARSQSEVIYTNPDGSKVSHEEIYGTKHGRANIAEGQIKSLEEEGNLPLIQNVSTVIERLDNLNEKEYDGFLNLTKDLASEFNVNNTAAENFKILKNLDTSELKKYREKMGLSKKDLLDLIVPPDGTSPWLEKLMNVGKKTLGKFKDF